MTGFSPYLYGSKSVNKTWDGRVPPNGLRYLAWGVVESASKRNNVVNSANSHFGGQNPHGQMRILLAALLRALRVFLAAQLNKAIDITSNRSQETK